MPEITEKQLPAEAKSLWLKAINSVQVANHAYAVTLLQSVLEISPAFLEGRRMLRKCELHIHANNRKKAGFLGSSMSRIKIDGQLKKNPSAAMVLIEKELAADPLSEQLNEQLFEACLKLDLKDSAAFALETVRDGDAAANSRLLHKLAGFYLDLDQPARAVDVYNDILKHHPNDGAAIKGMKDASARASMQRQKWDENTDMRSLLRNADESTQLEQSSRSGLTSDQLEERRDRAIEKYNANPNNLAIAKELASIYEQLEDWQNAHTFYDWAHSLSAGDVALATKAAAMNDRAIESDLEQLGAALQADPDNEELRQALYQRRSDRIAEQIQECQQRVEGNPTDPHLRYELGTVLYRAGDYNAAIPHLQQATRNPHIRTKVLLMLALCFKEKNMYDLAVKRLEEALSDLGVMDNTKKEVLYEKGLIHEAMGDHRSALESFKQIYEVDYVYRDVAKRVEASYA
jgi:tetratricopeptide (TPR) repeat protein